MTNQEILDSLLIAQGDLERNAHLVKSVAPHEAILLAISRIAEIRYELQNYKHSEDYSNEQA